MTVFQVHDSDGSAMFVNGFAANDPESTGQIWEMVLQRFGVGRRKLAVVNCRADRPDRSRQLAEACRGWTPADHYLAVGTATQLFAHRAAQLGIPSSSISCAERVPNETLLANLRQLAGADALIMGMGNISGPGMKIVDHFRQLHMVTPAQTTLLPPHTRSLPTSENVALRKAA